MTWTVLLATRGKELDVRNDLTHAGVPAYVPVECRMRKNPANGARGIPIAPPYVFADIDDWGIIRTIKNLQSRPLYTIAGRAVVLTQYEIDAVEAMSIPVATLKGEAHKFRLGEKVALRRGARENLDALVVRLREDGTAVGLVEFLGALREVVISRDMVAA